MLFSHQPATAAREHCNDQQARPATIHQVRRTPPFALDEPGSARAYTQDRLSKAIARHRETYVWDSELRLPLFPATRISLSAVRQFEVSGLERYHWSSASPIRKIFRAAFVSTSLPYFNPHSFRNALVQLGPERFAPPQLSFLAGRRGNFDCRTTKAHAAFGYSHDTQHLWGRGHGRDGPGQLEGGRNGSFQS